jgi:hypothetical protein
MKIGIYVLGLIAASVLAGPAVQAREWKNAAGEVVIDADLFGFDGENVVLKRADGELGTLKVKDLSDADREFLSSPEAQAIHEKNLSGEQKWTTTSGVELVGRIVDYTRKEITIQQRRGRTYVNDRRLTNLPEMIQQLVPRIIEHFDEVELPNQRAMQLWLRNQRGLPRTFLIEGVILETASGDEYPIPFFVFKDADRKLLKDGWTEWLARQNSLDPHDDLSFRLEAFTAAHLQNQALQREIALINLNLQAVQAGLTSIWEVTLYPDFGNPHPPMWVLMPGRNSEQAAARALINNPGFVVGSIRRVSR